MNVPFGCSMTKCAYEWERAEKKEEMHPLQISSQKCRCRKSASIRLLQYKFAFSKVIQYSTEFSRRLHAHCAQNNFGQSFFSIPSYTYAVIERTDNTKSLHIVKRHLLRMKWATQFHASVSVSAIAFIVIVYALFVFVQLISIKIN